MVFMHFSASKWRVSTKWGTPRTKWGAPRLKWGAPRAEWGEPRTKWGQPRAKRGAPRMKRGTPQTVWGAPQMKRGEPRTEWGTPRGIWGKPQVAWGAPRGEWGSPQTKWGDAWFRGGRRSGKLRCYGCAGALGRWGAGALGRWGAGALGRWGAGAIPPTMKSVIFTLSPGSTYNQKFSKKSIRLLRAIVGRERGVTCRGDACVAPTPIPKPCWRIGRCRQCGSDRWREGRAS